MPRHQYVVSENQNYAHLLQEPLSTKQNPVTPQLGGVISTSTRLIVDTLSLTTAATGSNAAATGSNAAATGLDIPALNVVDVPIATKQNLDRNLTTYKILLAALKDSLNSPSAMSLILELPAPMTNISYNDLYEKYDHRDSLINLITIIENSYATG